MDKKAVSRFGISLTLAVLLLLLTCGSALAWTAANLSAASSGEDQFYTYDFTGRTLSATGVDWPVTMIFYGNASVAKVKSAFQSRGWNNPFVSTMYGYLNDGTAFAWASDGGVKTFASKSAHLRLYAPGGRMYNSVWGYYVVATTHFDNAELASPPAQWFGMSEEAAAAAVQTAVKAWGSKNVTMNSIPLGNAQYGEEKAANGERHIWQCDGLATMIRVP